MITRRNDDPYTFSLTTPHIPYLWTPLLSRDKPLYLSCLIRGWHHYQAQERLLAVYAQATSNFIPVLDNPRWCAVFITGSVHPWPIYLSAVYNGT
jgi:hypothetical protein